MSQSAIGIGAGIFGTSIADALAERGWAVQLIDRQGPGGNLEEAWFGTWEIQVNLISGGDAGPFKNGL